jgi:hypothetical protein
LNTVLYALDVGYTKAYGGSNSTARHPKETESALFWGYGAGSCTPPGHWNQIATVVAQQRNLDLLESARLFALLNIAMADAAIVCWKCKYIDGLWRPITAIQLADTDGNPLTEADPNWAPLLATPPFPEYTSGHSTFSGAAATVLSAFFRGNERFTVGSDDLPGVLRSYKNFWDAAHESGVSRLYGGIHFWSANENGLSCGAAIGREINRMLRALPGSNGNGHGNGHGNAGHKH